MQTRIGFIGLGIMGRPMAKHLLAAGYPLIAHNRSRSAVDELAGLGAAAATSAAGVAAESDVIITMLPDSPDVEAVVLGPDGLAGKLRRGHLLIDMSTINPVVSRRIAAAIEPRGATMLDAPVSGGERGAIDATLSIMVGGSDSDFERALPVFQKLGRTITHMGPLGAGGFTKLANQIIVAVNLAAIGEALTFGTKAGVDPEKMVQALSGGLAGSRCLDQKAGKILSGDFSPGFKIDLHYKDLNLIHDAAREIAAPVPVAALIEQMFAALRRLGRGGMDHSGVTTLFEDLAGVEVRRRQNTDPH